MPDIQLLESVFADPVPKALYHYTSQKGLLGILDSQALWATNLRYMNDSQEFQHALALAASVLHARAQGASKEHREIIDVMQRTVGTSDWWPEIYIFSLSA